MSTLMGNYKVPHLDAKGEPDWTFEELGLSTTILRTSFFWDNFIYFGQGPRPDGGGKLMLTLPLGDKPLPSMAAEDVGKCSLATFRKGKELQGRVSISGENLTGHQIAEKLSAALGREMIYNPVSPDVFRSLGFPGAAELGNMFQFFHVFNDDFAGARDPQFARSLNPEMQTFEAWLAVNAGKIPVG